MYILFIYMYISISYHFYHIVSFSQLPLFFVILLSFGCCDTQISLFAGQIKEFLFWFWSNALLSTSSKSIFVGRTCRLINLYSLATAEIPWIILISNTFQEGDDTILVRVVPAKSSRPPGRIKMNFEDMEKNREEELVKRAEEEKKRRYDENKRSFRDAKRRSVVQLVGRWRKKRVLP